MVVKKEVVLPAGLVPAPRWADLRRELGIEEHFSQDALAEARASANMVAEREAIQDLTDVPFLTIDPAESMDLDQAMHLSRDGDGFLIRYAIADVAAFVAPGSVLDVEAHRRGETFYAPDGRVPLYPVELSEGAASLLPDQIRPAVVWTLSLDQQGNLLSASVERAVVRSQRRLDYQGAQALVESDPQIGILRSIGKLRQQLALERGAVDLPTTEQLVEVENDGIPRLVYRASIESERWNAQISLLTGMAAAQMMVKGGVGLLRTLPTPEAEAVDQLRLSAAALGLDWPADQSYGEYVTGLDPNDGASAALLTLATRLLRGAGYLALDGDVPPDHHHSAVAAPYAHCTAPLRRLADRYVNEVCLAMCAGVPVPAWVRTALPLLPTEMKKADARAGALQRATVDLAEAIVMGERKGETLDAVVVAVDAKGGVAQVGSPAVRGRCSGPLTLGARVAVRCVVADVQKRVVEFALSSG